MTGTSNVTVAHNYIMCATNLYGIMNQSKHKVLQYLPTCVNVDVVH